MPNLDSEEDYGLSDLAGRFHQDWTLEGTAHRVVEIYTEAEGAAELMLDDAVRLLRSPLSDAALTALWQAGTGGYQDLDRERRGIDVRQWLQEVVDICVERVRRDDPAFTVSTPEPEPRAFAEDVLEEIAEAGPVLEAAIAQSPYRSVLGVVPALREVVEHAGPGLGFRLFLRIMYEYTVPINQDRYRRYRALGEHLGLGEFHLNSLEFLTKLKP